MQQICAGERELANARLAWQAHQMFHQTTLEESVGCWAHPQRPACGRRPGVKDPAYPDDMYAWSG